VQTPETKEAIVTALRTVEQLDDDLADAIIGAYPEAGDLRPKAIAEVENLRTGCSQ
jgi:hypothetical protein